MAKSPNAKPTTPDVCPVCGEDVPRGALACPECGADHKSGWREDADAYDAVGLPDNEFDYDKFAQDEFGEGCVRSTTKQRVWWITAVILLLAFAALYFYG